MMLGPLIALVLAVGQAAPEGRLTASSGPVTIGRGGQSLAADARSAIAAGDALTTGPGAGASLMLGGDTAVYLGPGARMAIAAGSDGAAELRLEAGEMRVATESARGVAVVVPGGRASLQRGTLRTSTSAGGSRFLAEQGQAGIAAGRAAVALPQGQEVTVAPDGAVRGPIPAAPGGWSLDPDSLRLAGAAAESRRGKDAQVAQANDDVARDYARSQIGDGSTRPGVNPTQPGTTPTTTTGAAEDGSNPAELPSAPPATTAEEAAAEANAAYQPQALSQTNSSFSSITGSLALSGAGGAVSFAGSGGQGNDAQQDSRNPAFPGNIYLVTGLTRYSIDQVRLTPRDKFFTAPGSREYYSIGLGAPPTSQVRTNFITGTGATPASIRIPHFNAYVLNLSQFGIPDPGTAPVSNTNPAFSGISGLLGANPSSPQIAGATPLLDSRARFNPGATFALGEFALQRDPNHPRIPQIEVRRSDQDRLIVPGTGPADPAIPNPDVKFQKVADPRFFPEFPQGVFVPKMNSLANKPTVGTLDTLRRAAVTVLLADKLLDYSHRTGQTQFVLDGKIIDIAGYHRTLQFPRQPPTTSVKTAKATPTAGAGARASLASRATPGADVHRMGRPGLRDFGPRGEVARPGTRAAHRLAAHRAAAAHR